MCLLDGNCLQALEFYRSCFGGDLSATKVRDTDMKNFMPPVMHEKIINGLLSSGAIVISASDWLRPDQKPIQGNTVCLYLSGGPLEEIKGYFEKLSDGATISDPLTEQFFGTYGALTDKFGVRWMFHSNEKR